MQSLGMHKCLQNDANRSILSVSWRFPRLFLRLPKRRLGASGGSDPTGPTSTPGHARGFVVMADERDTVTKLMQHDQTALGDDPRGRRVERPSAHRLLRRPSLPHPLPGIGRAVPRPRGRHGDPHRPRDRLAASRKHALRRRRSRRRPRQLQRHEHRRKEDRGERPSVPIYLATIVELGDRHVWSCRSRAQRRSPARRA